MRKAISERLTRVFEALYYAEFDSAEFPQGLIIFDFLNISYDQEDSYNEYPQPAVSDQKLWEWYPGFKVAAAKLVNRVPKTQYEYDMVGLKSLKTEIKKFVKVWNSRPK